MKSKTTRDFWVAFRRLPRDRQEDARQAYRLWRTDPFHPSLHFKIIAGQPRLVSARTGLRWRVLGAREDNTIVWFWIGPHHEYDKLIRGR